MKRALRAASLVMVLGVAAAGCKKDAVPVASAPDDAATAKALFANRCTPCHGPQGRGDGPASAALTPRPRNLADPAWQSSVTDEQIEKIIAFGGAAVGKSPAMPPNPDLHDQEGVVKALRAQIRSLAKSRGAP